MSSDTELLRSFLAIYRSGSVTDAASHRGISQPAASQHLAALERIVGARLFARGPGGVEPTVRARELYAQVVEPLDALEGVLEGIRGRSGPAPARPIRIGSNPEYFAACVLPRLAGREAALSAAFGNDAELLGLLERGELDLAVTSTTPPRRTASAVPIGAKRFVLVTGRGSLPARPIASLGALADWLSGQAWVSYSLELPITRRFWQRELGRALPERPRLVAPDLRAVLRAVELGLGVSLLPTFVCDEPLQAGRVVEPYPVSSLVPEEPWFACTPLGVPPPEGLASLLDALSSSSAPSFEGARPPA